MHLRHFAVVIVLVCLVSVPRRSEGATIALGDLGTGAFGFSGELTTAGDIAFFSFSLSSESSIAFAVDSHLCQEPGDGCGFLPILTLFEGTVQSGSGYLLDATFDPTITTLPLDGLFGPGNYLLAITLYPNYFDPFAPAGFASELNPDFLVEAGIVLQGCVFPQPVGTEFLECRSGEFAGSLSIETEQVPEPGTLSFIVVGGASLAIRLRRKRRSRRQADVVDHS